MRTIVATDLDGTVLFSEREIPPWPPAAGMVAVDTGPIRSYMTAVVADRWERLARAAALVPATTRSVPQYLRLRLPGRPPPLAIVCNGARLLVDGDSDKTWDRLVRRKVGESAAPFATVWDQVATWHEQRSFKAVRAVEDFFVYLIVARLEDWLPALAAEAEEWARPRGWRVSLQGRKLYLLPAGLDKAAAVAHVAERLAADRVVAGGDSLLDAEMLRRADAAIRPAHGELHDAGFSAPRCRTTAVTGYRAGDEIIDWYYEQTGCESELMPEVGRISEA